MLVLKRNGSETIVINGGTPDEVRVTVIGWTNGPIRLGIEAPKNISVHRLEVFNRLEEAKNSMSESNSKILPADGLHGG